MQELLLVVLGICVFTGMSVASCYQRVSWQDAEEAVRHDPTPLAILEHGWHLHKWLQPRVCVLECLDWLFIVFYCFVWSYARRAWANGQSSKDVGGCFQLIPFVPAPDSIQSVCQWWTDREDVHESESKNARKKKGVFRHQLKVSLSSADFGLPSPLVSL